MVPLNAGSRALYRAGGILSAMKTRSLALAASVLAISAILGGTASAASSETNVKHAALSYAKATLIGSFADLEAALSPECRSTDHVTAQTLPLARSVWEHQMGVSFTKIRATGVRIRNLSMKDAVAEVQFNTPKAGNENWVKYVLKKGRWVVGGNCVVPIGNFGSPGASPLP
jgi:hypothetical protein